MQGPDSMEREEWEPEFPWKRTVHAATSGVRWRIYASILIPVAWSILMLVYAILWSGGLTLFQNFVVFVTSLVSVVAIVGLLWISMGFRFARGL
ncbi:MAG: hypothetical protein HY557_04065 [Euryarchaeota archaeon]|nr:hypothetical protein [Euryarchaeota archaeon]